MALFGIIFLFVMLVFVGIGIAIGAFVAALTFVLVSFGVLSSSVVVGIRRRSAHAGVRTFLLLCGVLGGIPCGIFSAWFAVSFLEAVRSDWRIFVYGGLSGAVAGLLVAYLLDYILGNSARGIAGLFKTRRAAGIQPPGSQAI